MKYQKSIILVSAFVLTSVTSLNVQAQMPIYLEDQEENRFTDGDSICANKPLTFMYEDSASEVLILDQATKEIKDVFNVSTDNNTIKFPANAGDVELMVTNYDDSNKLDISTQTSVSFNVKDCGEQTTQETNAITGEVNNVKVKEHAKYSTNNMHVGIEYKDDEVTLSRPKDYEKLKNYSVSYQLLDSNRVKTTKFKFADQKKVKLKGNTILQIEESYDVDGKQKTKYYELEVNEDKNTYFYRIVNKFELKKIDKKALINIKGLLLIVSLIILYMVLNLAYKKQRRRYRRAKKKAMQKDLAERRKKYHEK